MSEIVFFLEEPSAKAMLEGLLPRIFPEGVIPRYIVFEGKQDLDKQLVRKLRGYNVPSAKFVVLRDQDASDCKVLKKNLVKKCREAQKQNILVRIACRELESWYLADLMAVEQGLCLSGISNRQNERLFRSPDDTGSPKQALKQIAPSYQKIGGSRAIGPYLSIDNIRSRSFTVFVEGLRKLMTI